MGAGVEADCSHAGKRETGANEDAHDVHGERARTSHLPSKTSKQSCKDTRPPGTLAESPKTALLRADRGLTSWNRAAGDLPAATQTDLPCRPHRRQPMCGRSVVRAPASSNAGLGRAYRSPPLRCRARTALMNAAFAAVYLPLVSTGWCVAASVFSASYSAASRGSAMSRSRNRMKSLHRGPPGSTTCTRKRRMPGSRP